MHEKKQRVKNHCKLFYMCKPISCEKQDSVQKPVPNLIQDGGPAAQRGKTDYAVFPYACRETAGENKVCPPLLLVTNIFSAT